MLAETALPAAIEAVCDDVEAFMRETGCIAVLFDRAIRKDRAPFRFSAMVAAA